MACVLQPIDIADLQFGRKHDILLPRVPKAERTVDKELSRLVSERHSSFYGCITDSDEEAFERAVVDIHTIRTAFPAVRRLELR